MPLLKRRPFTLLEPPEGLEPHDIVYQVRFTKEIFRDYSEYLNRINFYRQRFWSCKITGKTNLTYEEALVSEKLATAKVQQFPKELMEPVLHTIQFSELSLKDLADTIAARLQECFFEGVELCGKMDDAVYSCKIVKVIKGSDRTQYEVAWLDGNKNITGNSLLDGEDLIWKKNPFSRSMLKSFIRECTYRSAPWVLHNNLARKHGIPTDPPEEMRSRVVYRHGLIVSNKKRRKTERDGNMTVEAKQKSGRNMNTEGEDDEPKEEPVRYPIDDLLVQPGADDPIFTDRPSPSRDFKVAMGSVGDLLFVWDFCSSFGRLLHLSPFSLEDFENAICHKDNNLILIVESHLALLQFLLKDNSEYFLALQEKKRKLKITVTKWTEYLCDFLEMIEIPELSTCVSIIKRGHYGLLDSHDKLGIFRELVNRALQTDLMKEKLDEYIEQLHELGATRRGQALEEARKKREEKEQLKAEYDQMYEKIVGSDQNVLSNGNRHGQSGGIGKKRNGEIVSSLENHAVEKSDSRHTATTKEITMKQKMNGIFSAETSKQLKDDKEEGKQKSSVEQRRENYEREMEKRPVRTNPLGKDREYNRYWWFRRDARVFVESADSKNWSYYSAKEELDALMGSLNRKGERERVLQKQLEKFYWRICSEIQKRLKDIAHKVDMDEAVVRRSARVRAPARDNPANAFLRYVNKWKEE